MISQQFLFIFAFSFVARQASALNFAARLAAAMSKNDALPSFASFIQDHQRTYTTDANEYEFRRNIYQRSLQQVRHHNSQQRRLWNAAVNHLSDRTEDELSQLRGLRIVQLGSRTKASGMVGLHLNQIRSAVIPDEKSWAHLDAVQRDIDQSSCGSCWAFATSIMLQSNAEIHGFNRTFSPQELVNCVPNSHNCGGTGGCAGATVELGMNWVMDQGLETESSTPYTAVTGSCSKASASLVSLENDEHTRRLEDMIAVGFHAGKLQKSPVADVQLQGWERLPENEYGPLIRAVAERGPVTVSVGASGWPAYGTGVFNACDKDAEIDHAVTLIGYGIDKQMKQKFWLIKNSWGNHWGEGGNIRLLREEGNVHCGTDRQPQVGTACDGGPSTVPVCGMCGILYDAVVPHFKKRM